MASIDGEAARSKPLARDVSAGRRRRRCVAAWSFSSSLTSPRQKSDERTSVGRKCFAAKVDLPEPRDADQHDERRVRGS